MKRFLARLWLLIADFYCWKHTREFCEECSAKRLAKRKRFEALARGAE